MILKDDSIMKRTTKKPSKRTKKDPINDTKEMTIGEIIFGIISLIILAFLGYYVFKFIFYIIENLQSIIDGIIYILKCIVTIIIIGFIGTIFCFGDKEKEELEKN